MNLRMIWCVWAGDIGACSVPSEGPLPCETLSLTSLNLMVDATSHNSATTF